MFGPHVIAYNMIRLGNLLNRRWRRHKQMLAQRCGQGIAIREPRRGKTPQFGCSEPLKSCKFSPNGAQSALRREKFGWSYGFSANS